MCFRDSFSVPVQNHPFAKDPAYNCPEPVMLLVGGDPDSKWNVRAFVFPKGEMIEMHTADS
jgi:hypothetical protein